MLQAFSPFITGSFSCHVFVDSFNLEHFRYFWRTEHTPPPFSKALLIWGLSAISWWDSGYAWLEDYVSEDPPVQGIIVQDAHLLLTADGHSRCGLLVLIFRWDSRRAYNWTLFLVEFLADALSTAICFITINHGQYSWSAVLSTGPPCGRCPAGGLRYHLIRHWQGPSQDGWPYTVSPTVDGVMVPRPWS